MRGLDLPPTGPDAASLWLNPRSNPLPPPLNLSSMLPMPPTLPLLFVGRSAESSTICTFTGANPHLLGFGLSTPLITPTLTAAARRPSYSATAACPLQQLPPGPRLNCTNHCCRALQRHHLEKKRCP